MVQERGSEGKEEKAISEATVEGHHDEEIIATSSCPPAVYRFTNQGLVFNATTILDTLVLY